MKSSPFSLVSFLFQTSPKTTYATALLRTDRAIVGSYKHPQKNITLVLFTFYWFSCYFCCSCFFVLFFVCLFVGLFLLCFGVGIYFLLVVFVGACCFLFVFCRFYFVFCFLCLFCCPTKQKDRHTLESAKSRAARYDLSNYTSRTPGSVTPMLKHLLRLAKSQAGSSQYQRWHRRRRAFKPLQIQEW